LRWLDDVEGGIESIRIKICRLKAQDKEWTLIARKSKTKDRIDRGGEDEEEGEEVEEEEEGC
jgi:hypothetical protein